MLSAIDASSSGRTRGTDSRKADFPLLRDTASGRPLHYLDNAATTHKPAAVIDAISACYREYNAPVHRGLYPLAEEATQRYEQARATLARFIGASSSKELVFTRSTTEAINMVAWGWARPRLTRGDRIWVTRMEHHANLLPWQRVCRERGAELRVIELREDGSLDWQGAEGLFERRSRLIALSQVSNVLGIENPVQALCAAAADAAIPVLVDAAQSVAHCAVDVTALNCDFLAFSAHKMYGPSGIGALYAKAQRLEEMEPLLVGGGMVDRVSVESASWAGCPERFEAGSPNLAGAAGFAAAAGYLAQIGMDRVHAHVSALTRRALDALADIPGLRLMPDRSVDRPAIVSFIVEGIHPHDLAQIAGEQGVALRAGHHCCQPLMQHLGVAGTARASLALYNNVQDIEALLRAIERARRLFATGA
jgi:cysteine desulfurase / selenocysteine lyase